MPVVYMIPSLLDEEGIDSIPSYIIPAIKDCQAFFVENERTTRRYFKKLWKACLPGQEMVIDNYEWINMTETSNASDQFRKKIKENKNIGIVSEAGCPGIADPGQQLVSLAQSMGIEIKPLVGPSSILLALMASGMNGQQFHFAGYLPVKEPDRSKMIKDLENASAKRNVTQIFIETPYRNNQMIDVLLKNCDPLTQLCLAVDITGKNEWIKTKRVSDWKNDKPDINKRPAIFLIYAGE